MTPKDLKQRRQAAQAERDAFQPLLDDAYHFAVPFRRSNKDTGTGESRVNQVFDHTAIDGAFRFAGKIQQDLWPAGQENFQLEPGPLVRDPGQREALASELSGISKTLQAFFDDGSWDMALHEAALDLSIGTGAILMLPTEDPTRLWDPMSAPMNELLLEPGPRNTIGGIFWGRKLSARTVFDTWPRGRFGADLHRLRQEKPEDPLEVNLDTVLHPPRGGRRGFWRTMVWSPKQEDAAIADSVSRTCPWLTPRYFRVPGEVYGRGPVMLAMPTIKVLNTAARLQLQAAAIAMLGIYTAVDDGVFNPDLSPLEPGVFWKVARNGGAALGPTVERFPDPRLDLSGLVVENLQMQVKATLMDQALPVEGAAVKSATEILERVRRLASDHLGAYGRLVNELVVPAAKRVMEIAWNRGLIAHDVPIDQLLVRVRVKSPLAIARETQRVEKIVNWLQMVLMTSEALGKNPERLAEFDRALIDIGRELGVPEAYIVPPEKREQMDEAAAQAAQVQAMAAAAGQVAEGLS